MKVLARSTLAALLLVSLSYSQSARSSPTRAGEPVGAEPAVSMEKAYIHFFLVFGPSSTPSLRRTAEEEAAALADRRQSLARHIGLNEEQAAIVIEVAMKYQEYVEALRNEALRVAGPPREGGRMTEAQSKLMSNVFFVPATSPWG